MGVSDVVYYRHACEAVIVVEALEHGRKALEQLRELVQATLAGEHDPEPLLQPLFLWQWEAEEQGKLEFVHFSFDRNTHLQHGYVH